MTLSIISIFIFGLIIGSFLNVVILRYNTGRSVNGRSGCLSCGHKLKTSELIPVLSFIFLKGRCSGCGSKISMQYPLVELGIGLLFVLIFLKFSSDINFMVFLLISTSVLVVILVYDIRHKIIPDGLVYTLAGLSLVYRIIETPFNNLSLLTTLDLLAGPILFIPFYLLWVVSRGRWIGLGDGKLALVIGWMLGFVMGLSAITIAFWIGAIISVTILLIDRLKVSSVNITMKTEVPFAPFLIIGLILMLLYPFDVLGIGLFFNL